MRADEMVTAGVRALTLDECWDLLQTTAMGRLAVLHDGAPAIFPVNHLVDRRTLVFRSGQGTKRRAARGGPVAFEIDGVDDHLNEAWSVVVTGAVVAVRDPAEVDALDAANLVTWQGGPKPHYLRLAPQNVTGRRFPVGVDVAVP